MRRNMTNFVKSCRTCQPCAKGKKMLNNYHQPVNRIFDTFSKHLAGPLPETKRKYQYILLIVEHLKGWFNAGATVGQVVHIEISIFKEEIDKQFGGPSVVLTE